MASDFFISYASADRAWAEWIAWQLEEAGYSVLVQASAFRAGENLVTSISRALNDADNIIAVISPDYLRSTSTQSEYQAAFSRRSKRLLPVIVRPTVLPAFLRPIVTLDLFGVGEESARELLLGSVSGRHRPRIAPNFPGQPPIINGPTFPDAPGDDGPSGPADSQEIAPEDMRALVISAEKDMSFAQELLDSLRGLRAEFSLSSIDLHVVGNEDARSSELVDLRAREANIVLLVVSRDLLATDYGSSREVRMLLRRHNDRQSVVFPVIFRDSSWQGQPFGRLVPLPPGGTPVVKWPSRDEAVKQIIDGVRLAVDGLRQSGTRATPAEDIQAVEIRTIDERATRELGAVFKPSGVPVLTFVEPNDFVEFRMALRQPGLGIALEGPSGIGKTTILRHAVQQDAHRLGQVRILSARKPTDIEEISRLPSGHTGLVAVDDFHRLPNALQVELADYLKRLADDDADEAKLVVVGIPGTAQELVSMGSDLATRIRVFRPGRAADSLVLQMIEKGEDALNIAFEGKADIVLSSVGSLLTAQMLCWHLAMMAGIEETARVTATIPTDVVAARARVTESLRLKYQPMVDQFIVLDEPTESLCIDLLLLLAETADGVLRLDWVKEEHPSLSDSIDRVFTRGLPNGFGAEYHRIAEHLYYDPGGKRLVADDPQFIFYICQLRREELLTATGKQLPVPRDQVFVCYSHNDASWLERLLVHLKPLERQGIIDVWSDRRLQLGDEWRKEIERALARARIALLLVSADFMASDFIQEAELPSLLSAAEQGGCRVIPILVRPSLFTETPSLSRFQHENPRSTTLSEMTRVRSERVLTNIVRSLMALLGGNLQ